MRIETAFALMGEAVVAKANDIATASGIEKTYTLDDVKIIGKAMWETSGFFGLVQRGLNFKALVERRQRLDEQLLAASEGQPDALVTEITESAARLQSEYVKPISVEEAAAKAAAIEAAAEEDNQ